MMTPGQEEACGDWAWRWMAKGLEGAVNMLRGLDVQGAECPPQTLNLLEDQADALAELVRAQRAKGTDDG